MRTDSHEHNAHVVHCSIKIGWFVFTYVLKVFAVRVLYASSGWSLDSDVSGHPSHRSKDKKVSLLGLIDPDRPCTLELCTYPDAGYPDWFGLSRKYVENSRKLTCLEITGYRRKYSRVLWLLALQIRSGRKV